MIDQETVKAAVDAVRAAYDIKISQLEASNKAIHGEIRDLAATVRELKEELLKIKKR